MSGSNGKFVHLHLHTQYSLLDGAIKVNELVQKVRELGMHAVAVTDHGRMIGAVKFYKAAVDAGIKPLIGVEAYIVDDVSLKREAKEQHVTLIALNEVGYNNLVRLTSFANTRGFYRHPRIDLPTLEEHSEGIALLTGCIKGVIPDTYLHQGTDAAISKIDRLLKAFEGRLFLEVMKVMNDEHKRKEQEVNQFLLDTGYRKGIPVVATNDCHYLTAEDEYLHEVLLCINTGSTLQNRKFKFNSTGMYVKSPEEMAELFKAEEDKHSVLSNTVLLADMVDFELKPGNYMPDFDCRAYGYDTCESMLVDLARRGLEQRLKRIDPREHAKYRHQLEHELRVINELGFAGYFLIVWDFVNYAKKHGIPVGPGRGSAAGALVSYALGITEVDPLRWGLLFERFLNPERVSMPDIDIDFCMNRREEVINYLKERYGADSVSRIGTVGSINAKMAIRDVGRVMGFPTKIVNSIAKSVGNISSLSELSEEDCKHIARSVSQTDSQAQEVERLFKIARGVEGLSRQLGTHAAGVVITVGNTSEQIPVFVARDNTQEIITQYDKDDLEWLGYLKIDVLGLTTLTEIQEAVDMIKERYGVHIDFSRVNLEDRSVYKMLTEGKTVGVFQLESSGMRNLLRRLKPTKFEDLIALVALYRPGPLGSGMVDEFIDRKHGKKPIEYELPQLEPILAETYGVILYQEQVMKIAVEVAGFTMAEADILRKAMGKKKADIMAQMREKFVTGAVERGVDRAKAEALFDKMAEFAKYGFNKSHSTAYALLAYYTAWLKRYYPLEFMCALARHKGQQTKELIRVVKECSHFGIDVLPPDINKSDVSFSIEMKGSGSVGDVEDDPEGDVVTGCLRWGLSEIKGVGVETARVIVEERKANGPYKDAADFIRRVVLPNRKVTKKVLEALVNAGCFDSFIGTGLSVLPAREAFYEYMLTLMEVLGGDKHRSFSLFDMMGLRYKYAPAFQKVHGDIQVYQSSRLKLAYSRAYDTEVQLVGISFHRHPSAVWHELIHMYNAVWPSHITAKTYRNHIKDMSKLKVLGLLQQDASGQLVVTDVVSSLRVNVPKGIDISSYIGSPVIVEGAYDQTRWCIDCTAVKPVTPPSRVKLVVRGDDECVMKAAEFTQRLLSRRPDLIGGPYRLVFLPTHKKMSLSAFKRFVKPFRRYNKPHVHICFAYYPLLMYSVMTSPKFDMLVDAYLLADNKQYELNPLYYKAIAGKVQSEQVTTGKGKQRKKSQKYRRKSHAGAGATGS